MPRVICAASADWSLTCAGDHQHEVRELRLQALRELRDGAGDGRGVEHGDAGVILEQVSGEIRFGADRGDFVLGGDGAQGLQQLDVVREHDQAFGRQIDDLAAAALMSTTLQRLIMTCIASPCSLVTAGHPAGRGRDTWRRKPTLVACRGPDSVDTPVRPIQVRLIDDPRAAKAVGGSVAAARCEW